jgi:hypothetical protein
MQHPSPTKGDQDFRQLISESVILTSPRKHFSEAASPPPQVLSPAFVSNVGKSPSKKDLGIFLPQQQYVRVPISISLLHAISQLKTETNGPLYERRLKIIKEQAQKLVDKQIKTKDLAKLDFLSSFVQSQSTYVLVHLTTLSSLTSPISLVDRYFCFPALFIANL